MYLGTGSRGMAGHHRHPGGAMRSTRGRGASPSGLALDRRDLDRVGAGGREHRTGHGHLLLGEVLESVILPVAGHRRRGGDVELAISAQDGERNSFTCADLRALAVTVAAQALPETARHVHNGPRDSALGALRMVHARHALLRRGGPGARQAQPSGDGGDGKQTTDHWEPPTNHVTMSRRKRSTSAWGGPGSFS